MDNEIMLIRAIDEVLQKSKDVGYLLDVLTDTKNELSNMRYEFDGILSEQPSSVKEACSETVGVVNRAFDDYFALLERLENIAGSFDEEALMEIKDEIFSVVERLDLAFFNFRQKALESMGPTLVPGINLIINTSKRILEGEDLASLLEEQVIREIQASEDFISEAEDEALDVVPFYEEYVKVLVDFKEYFDSKDVEKLKKLMERLEETGTLYKELTGIALYEKNSKSPTSSPSVNMVINCAIGVKKGELEAVIFEKHLRALWGELERMKFKFETMTRSPIKSPLLEEEAEITKDTISALEDVLLQYFEMLDSNNFDKAEELGDKLAAITKQLEKSMKNFEEMSAREGKILCIRCGHYNPPNRRVCEKCNASLLHFKEVEVSDIDFVEGDTSVSRFKPAMTTNIEKLLETAQQYVEGVVSFEEFESVISWMEGLLESSYQYAGPVPDLKDKDKERAEQFKRMLEETADLYLQALEDFEVGLSFMRQVLQDRSIATLKSASHMIWQAVGKLQQVQKVTEPLVKAKK